MERDMSIQQAVISFWKNGLKFKGRSRRREYWLSLWGHVLICFLIGALIFIVDIITGYKLDISDKYMYFIENIFYWIAFIPGMAIGFRRLQDININGIYSIIRDLLYVPVIILGYVYPKETISNMTTPLGMTYTIFDIILLIAALVLFIMACIEGTRGPNKYGADPKYID